MNPRAHSFGRALRLSLLLIAAAISSSCDLKSQVPPLDPQSAQPGGSATYATSVSGRLDTIIPTLPLALRPEFHAGRALARQPWIKAPATTTARDGLGPLYNARTCLDCHQRGGRGHAPADGESLRQGLVRLGRADVNLESTPESTPDTSSVTLREAFGSWPDPIYGGQIQNHATSLAAQLKTESKNPDSELLPEANVRIHWQSQGDYRRPQVVLDTLAYGPLHADTQLSVRMAPPLFGLGLLAAIPQAQLEKLADPNDEDNDGISGRVNQVYDPLTKRLQPGRFGLKANRPNLETVIAAAFAEDIGISNPLFPYQPCTREQVRCQQEITGNNADGFELPQNLLDLVTEYVRLIGVPARAAEAINQFESGREAFHEAGCQRCHRPSHRTGTIPALAALSEQVIWPYTDLLLHDMGAELADHRNDYTATGTEWRTAPLWGMRFSRGDDGQFSLLHDGRARSIAEAVFWHGGEAASARARFNQFEPSKQMQLTQFVESL